MQATVGGNVVYPNLQEIADLFRTQINDTFNNAGGSGVGFGGGAGSIMPNSNPDLVTFLRSGIRTLYSDLRNVGDPELILDNYILTNLPLVNSWLGPGVANPASQVSLAYSGFFDGVQWYPEWTLPVSTRRVLAINERQSGTNDSFQTMSPAPFGLPGVMQGQYNRLWEMRQGQVWMPGTIQPVDLRLRVRIGYPSTFNVANLDYNTTYVPILNCADAIVAKMLVKYAIRFAPEQYQMCVQEEQRQMDKLFLESVRQMQTNENQRAEFGGEAVQDFAIAWSWL